MKWNKLCLLASSTAMNWGSSYAKPFTGLERYRLAVACLGGWRG